MKNITILFLFIFIFIYVFGYNSCQNKLLFKPFKRSVADSIKNKALENEIVSFLQDSKKYSLGATNTVIVTFYKYKYFWKVDLSNSDQIPDYKDLYGVLELNGSRVIIYSKMKLADFIFVSKPYSVDTLIYKKEGKIGEIADYYFDQLYFNGERFSHDSTIFSCSSLNK